MELGVALVGYKFMGKAHSHAYKDVGMFFYLPAKPVMRVLCGRNAQAVAEAARAWGWQETDTDFRRAVSRDDVHIVDIASPGDTHKDVALAAAAAGKHVICEKPLANTLAEAEAMVEAVERAGVKNMVAFNYRRVPAVQLAKRMIEDGTLGEIYHFRAVYLQDWIIDPDFPLVWRLRKEVAGSGPLGDLGAHIVDLARFLVGEITEVVGSAKTFIKERPLPEDDQGAWGSTAGEGKAKGEVTVEDAVVFLAHFANGALGTFEATRFAAGRKNYNCFEINGSKGSVVFNLERLNELQYFNREDPDHAQGFRTIIVTEPSHPYIAAWWPPGHIIGWEHTFIHEVKDFVEAIVNDTPVQPSFRDGLQTQSVLESVMESTARRTWTPVRNFLD
ncbi:MAG TPA: Gfo/Idh/MocA family oxidoreductase [Limnochordales bacterium]|nr:Gfo/Idh/MocA family oxidoreductase [Limnochordales bacterium]